MQNVKPKKHLGQHFLTDKNIAVRIVELLVAQKEDNVLEIGPGKGVLSEMLMPQYPRLTMLELDKESVKYLKFHFQSHASQVIFADVLKWDWDKLAADSWIISNLPYNISSPVLFKILENRPLVKGAVFMLQKEVAQRICSPPGNKTYGILSVLLGYYYDLSYEFSVPPSAFYPPPKVQSGVIRLIRKELEPGVDFEDFKKVVKAGFSKRRKTLRNALRPLLRPGVSLPEEILKSRAEQLSPADFVAITKQLFLR